MNRKDRRAAGQRPGPPASRASALFALAVHHHQAGQLFEAEGLSRQVLEADGRHFGSLVVLTFRSSYLNVPRVLTNFGIGPLVPLICLNSPISRPNQGS